VLTADDQPGPFVILQDANRERTSWGESKDARGHRRGSDAGEQPFERRNRNKQPAANANDREVTRLGSRVGTRAAQDQNFPGIFDAEGFSFDLLVILPILSSIG
jgi:hypothetical protein